MIKKKRRKNRGPKIASGKPGRWATYSLILICAVALLVGIGIFPDGAPKAEKVRRPEFTAEQLAKAELAPKKLKLRFLDALEKNPKTPPEILEEIPALRKDIEWAIESYKSGFAVEQRKASASSLEALEKSGAEPVEVLKENGETTGFIYAKFGDVQLRRVFERQVLDDEERVTVTVAAALVAKALGDDHEVVRAFQQYPVERMKYRIGIVNGENKSPINGLVLQAKLSPTKKPMVLLSPEPLHYQTSPAMMYLKTASTLIEEYYHILDPTLRDQLHGLD